MTRTTKLQIGLDIKPLREDTKKAKQAIEELGRVKIDRGLRNQLKDLFGKQLTDDARKYKAELERVRGELRNISLTDAFSTQRAQSYIKTIDTLNRGLQQTQRLQRTMGSGGGVGGGFGGGGSAGGGPGGGGGRGSFLNRVPGGGLIRGATSTLGAIGIGVGVAASVSRQAELGRASLGVRSLTGGSTVSGNSDYGFLQSERLERGKAIAATAGRNMSSEAISKEVNKSEMYERAYGISGEEYAGARGAARKAGVSDPGKFVASAIGDAVALKLEGSAIGEYLSSMSDYLSSVSKGVNVNQGSLRGFAAALGALDFFKQDPSRIFDTIAQMESVFKGGGNEYQQFSNYQSIQEAAMDANGRGLTAAGVNVRQKMGMFGSASNADRANLKKSGMGDLLEVMDVGGDKAMKKTLEREFKTAMEIGGGDHQLAADVFTSNAPGMNNSGGVSAFASMAANGGKLSVGGLAAAKKGAATPEEKAAANMASFDASVVKFVQRMDDLQNTVSQFVTDGTLKFVGAVDAFSKTTGLLKSDIEKLAAAVLAFTAIKALAGGGGGGGTGAGSGSMLLGGVTAAALGYEIGTAMREKLDEWTEGKFSDTVNHLWLEGAKALGFDLDGEKSDRAAENELKHGKDWNEAGRDGGYVGKGGYSQEDMASLSEMHDTMKQEMRDYAKKRGGPLRPSDLDDPDSAQVVNRFEQKRAKEKKANGGFIGLAEGGGVPEYNPPEDREARRAYNKWYNAQVEAAKLGQEPDGSKDMASSITAFAKSKIGRAHGGTVGVSSINGWARGGSMGRDNIDAKMMGGEFVVNARDSSANMMALVHANSGGKIRPLSEGGYLGDAEMEYAEGGKLPGGIDVEALGLALGGNVEATNMLTRTITQLAAGGGIIKGHPRGSGGMRYGRA